MSSQWSHGQAHPQESKQNRVCLEVMGGYVGRPGLMLRQRRVARAVERQKWSLMGSAHVINWHVCVWTPGGTQGLFLRGHCRSEL